MTDEILKRIDALAAKLGVTADHLWGVLVKEARIEAIEYIAWALLWAVICFVCAYIAVGLFKAKDRELFWSLGVVSACIAVVCFFVACGEIAGTPGMFLNPEYWALKEIAKAFGK